MVLMSCSLREFVYRSLAAASLVALASACGGEQTEPVVAAQPSQPAAQPDAQPTEIPAVDHNDYDHDHDGQTHDDAGHTHGPEGHSHDAPEAVDGPERLEAFDALWRYSETHDTDSWVPDVTAYYSAGFNPGNVAVLGTFVEAMPGTAIEYPFSDEGVELPAEAVPFDSSNNAVQHLAVTVRVEKVLAGDLEAAPPGDRIEVMLLADNPADVLKTSNELADVGPVVLFLYRDPSLFPERPEAFVLEEGLMIGFVDDDNTVRFPFAKAAFSDKVEEVALDTIG